MKIDFRYKLHQALNIGTVSVFSPVIALFCQYKGMDLSQIGIFFGVYFLGIMVFEVPSGVWADKFGHIKLFKISKVFDGINFLLIIYFDAVYALYLASFIGGVARALGSGTIEAWYVQRLKQTGRYHELKPLLSKAHGWMLFAMATGSLLGTALVQLGREIADYSVGYLLVLSFCLVMHLSVLLSCPWFFSEGEHQSNQLNPNSKRVLIKALKHCLSSLPLRWVLLLQLMFGVLLTSVQTYWQPWLHQLVDREVNTLLFGTVSALFFALASCSSSLVNRVALTSMATSIRKVLAMFILTSMLVVVMANSQSPIVFVFVYMNFGLVLFMVKPILSILMHRCCQDEHRATAISLLSLTANVGGVLVGITLSGFAQKFGIDSMWKLICTLIFAASACMLFYSVKRVQNREPQSVDEI
ncbi:MFS transporter [Vibrio sonorensis]|uniref:MFS transporter n=1 Tax=Vibrio sonorensis TaxID=1004316 RepID=UPI0008DA912D|nr:MFS transporter [Vibrio sonorensis]